MESISLFGAELDRGETKKNVKKFFKRDFERALNYSKYRRSDVSSPSFEATSTSNAGNPTESKFIINTLGDMCVERTVEAIGMCSQDTQFIIKAKYFNNLPDYVTYTRMSIKDSQYYRLQAKAICEFAQVFDSLERKYPLDLAELATYKE